MKDAIKTVLHGLGLYAPARALCRAMSRGHREEHRLRREFFAQLVLPGDLCFDIGANVGQSMVRTSSSPSLGLDLRIIVSTIRLVFFDRHGFIPRGRACPMANY